MTTSHMRVLLVALVPGATSARLREGVLRWINPGIGSRPGLARISGREVPLGA